jgi:glycosyltransferase involved in cell wall biosynthesis
MEDLLVLDFEIQSHNGAYQVSFDNELIGSERINSLGTHYIIDKNVLPLLGQSFQLNNKEIIIIDDGSTDGSQEIIKDASKNSLCKTSFQDKNLGKGNVLKIGFKMTTGNIITIQDGDLELNPEEYKKLIFIIYL